MPWRRPEQVAELLRGAGMVVRARMEREPDDTGDFTEKDAAGVRAGPQAGLTAPSLTYDQSRDAVQPFASIRAASAGLTSSKTVRPASSTRSASTYAPRPA